MALQTINSNYRQLSDIAHVLLRSEMYSGSRQMTSTTKYLLHADGKIYADNIQYVPACLLFANELLCNSFDEAVRARQQNRNNVIDKIEVSIDLDKPSITVTDNGGIVVAIDAATNMPIPTLIFGNLRTGENYTDSRGDTAGMNGIGVKLVNIFSKQFTVTTSDSKQSFKQVWTNNMHTVCDAIVSDCKNHFTEVIAEFDTSEQTKLPERCYDMTWARCIEMRCAELAAMASTWEHKLTIDFSCKFTDINGTLQQWSNTFSFARFEDYLKLWPNCDNMIIDKNYRFNMAVCLSNGSIESSAIVNGLQCPWGTHIDTFIDACVWNIRAVINNRFKIDIKPAKIKSYFKCISIWQINAATFAGQTKEQLISDVKDFGMPVIPSEQFIKKLLRSEIVTTIIEELHNKIAEQRRAEIAIQQKEIDKRTKRNIMPQKLADAANASRGKYCELYVVEGDSASCGISKFRSAETQGVMPLFGKSCGNMLYSDEMRVLGNKALSALCQALGFSFLGGQRLRYDKIIISCDADYDGSAITGLLLTFFNKFMPEVIEQGRLYRLCTPIIVAHNAKTNEYKYFYSIKDFENNRKAINTKLWSVSYTKGLASYDDDTYYTIMHSPILIQVIKDDLADISLQAWFGNDSSKRKELMDMTNCIIDDVIFDIHNAEFANNAEDEQELDY